MKFLLFCLSLISTHAMASEIYGYYSNVNSELAEPSGYEVLILNNGQTGRNDISVLLQRFEGWPQQPELLACVNCSAESIAFASEVMGRFEGKVINDILVGEFVEMGYSLKLPKSPSFWQSR